LISCSAALAVWLALASIVQAVHWSLAGGLLVNAIVYGICVPILERYRHIKHMPLIVRQWYDVPLRASLVALLVGTVVTLSHWVGPTISGILALFPLVFTSMMLILHPRIGGPATAAVVANSGWGMVGFGLGITMLYVGALRFGSAAGLLLGLATSVVWNLALWWNGRRKAMAVIASEAKQSSD
jgi:hypothetical protein